VWLSFGCNISSCSHIHQINCVYLLLLLAGGLDNNDFCFSTILYGSHFPCFLFVIIYVKSFLLVPIKRESENYSLVLRANSNAGIQNRHILNNDGDLCFN